MRSQAYKIECVEDTGNIEDREKFYGPNPKRLFPTKLEAEARVNELEVNGFVYNISVKTPLLSWNP